MVQTATRRAKHQQSTQQQAPEPAPQSGQLEKIEKPRLPYPPPGVLRHYGFDGAQWRTFVEAVWPGAKTVEGVLTALDYCKARHLDPFKRPVHIVPIYDKSRKREVESVWPGINEVRTTAARTGLLAGWEPTEFGPTHKFSWIEEGEDRHAPVQHEIEYPEWARVTVYRRDAGGNPRAYPGPIIRWREYYATAGYNTIAPNAMWRRKTWFMLEKCAQAAALRAAFPEELGNEYTAEEMFGQVVDHLTSEAPPPRPRMQDFIEQDTASADNRQKGSSAGTANVGSGSSTESPAGESGIQPAETIEVGPQRAEPPATFAKKMAALVPAEVDGHPDWQGYAKQAEALIATAAPREAADFHISTNPHLQRLKRESIELFNLIAAAIIQRSKGNG